jgi:colanic acid biosynthesis glycosyl transferase WcaI
MRIFLIVIQFPPDVNSTGNLMADLGAELVRKGHQVSVVTALPHYQDFHIAESYRGKLFHHERMDGMDILRLWVYATGRKSMVNRLINYLSFALGAAIAGVFWKKSWDVILCTNGGFFSGIAAWLIGVWKRAPFIYNVQDLYPEVPIEAGQLRNRFAIAALKRIEGFMYRKAAAVSVISATLHANLLGKKVPAEKLALIANFVDSDFIRPLPRANDFSRAHGLDDRFVVMHAGNLGYVYDLDGLLAAAKMLAADDEIIFLIVGAGVAKSALEEKAKLWRLPNVRFLPFQSREQLPWLRATADVQVSLYKRGAAAHSMPSKIYEIMASGRPLLASAERGSAVWQVVNDNQCGICVEPEQPELIAEAVQTLRRDLPARQELGQNGRHAAETRYSKQTTVEAYEELMQQIAGGSIAAADRAGNTAARMRPSAVTSTPEKNVDVPGKIVPY